MHDAFAHTCNVILGSDREQRFPLEREKQPGEAASVSGCIMSFVFNYTETTQNCTKRRKNDNQGETKGDRWCSMRKKKRKFTECSHLNVRNQSFTLYQREK